MEKLKEKIKKKKERKGKKKKKKKKKLLGGVRVGEVRHILDVFEL